MNTSLIDRIDQERLAADPLLRGVEYHDTIGSTQDRAHQIVRGDTPPALPLLIVAEEQTAGRGRGANRWWTAAGSLAFSFVFDPADWLLSSRPVPERSLAVGVAIVDTVAPLLAGMPVGLHWPNDVFVNARKLAGVLIDVLPAGIHIVGVGLNVNNGFHDAPADVRVRATSLSELTGRRFDRTALLLDLLRGIRTALVKSAASPQGFGRRFGELCLQVGAELTIEVGSQRTTGRCAGIDIDGALLLETDQGMQRFYSGVLR